MKTLSAASWNTRAKIAPRRGGGFTLIELMITVAIVAIVTALAYPSYQKQIIRGQRTAGQNFVMDLAQRNEQYFLDNRTYATTMAQLGYAAEPPEVSPYYGLPTINFLAGPPAGYNISIAPLAGTALAQANSGAGDGTLWVNNLAQHYRAKTNTTGLYVAATDCVFEVGTCIPQ